MLQLLRLLVLGLLLAGPLVMQAQPCATSYSLTVSPLPTAGTYACGQSVTFCFTVTGWNSTNANWFHGITASFGPGWDMSTLSPGPPPATCGASAGTWGWENSVQGTAGSNIGAQGPGFFFDLDNDGNPGNNFGDFCVGVTDWEFCWTINVLDGPACLNGLGLGVTFNTFGDSETGGWGSAACNTDPIIPSPPAVIQSCSVSAGTDGSISLCSSSPAASLAPLLGGTPDVGGQWTDPSGAVHSGTFDPASDLAGDYTYTVTSASPPCSSQAIVSVALITQPDAGTDGTVTTCSNASAFALSAELNGTPDAGGTWTDPLGVAFSGTFDPATDIGGAYTYTIAAAAPCAASSAAVTVTISPSVSAGADASMTLCSTGAVVDLFAQLGGSPAAGGSWTGPANGTFSGQLDPSQDAGGAYTYTVTGAAPCPLDQAVITITINAQPNAGVDAATTFCSSASSQPLAALLGGTPTIGGSWTGPTGAVVGASINPVNAASGSYTYTVNGTAPCVNDQAVVNVTIIQQASAGTDGTLLLCDASSPADLVDALGGSPDAGGTWTDPTGSATGSVFTPGTSVAGLHTYSITATAPCIDVSTTVDVTVLSQPNAGADNQIELCGSGATTNLFDLLGPSAQSGGVWSDPTGDPSPGSIDPTISTSGTYTYTLNAPAPCISSSATVTVDIIGPADAGTGGTINACTVGGAVDLFDALGGTPEGGGSWTDALGNPATAVQDPASAQAGDYTYTVTGTAPCPSASSVVELSLFDTPDSGTDAVLTLCDLGLAAFDLFAVLGGAPNTGGTWTDPDGNVHSATFDPATDAAGLFTYTLNGLPPCPSASSTVEITLIAPVPNGETADLALCSNADPLELFDEFLVALPTNGTWTSPGGGAMNGTFVPGQSAAGTYTYTLQGQAPCPNGVHTVDIVIETLPDAGTNGVLTLCSASGPTGLIGSLGGSPDAGGNWTPPDGGTSTGTINPGSAAQGTYIYTVAGGGLCPDAIAEVEVSIIEAPNSGSGGPVALCSTSPETDPFVWLSDDPDLNGTWEDPSGNTITALDPATAAPGLYTYTVAGTTPCPDAQTQLNVTIEAPPTAGDDGMLELCAEAAAVTLSSVLPANAQGGGSWSSPNGFPLTTFDPSQDIPGEYTYTVQGSGACADESDAATITITVLPSPTPSFSSVPSVGCAPLQVQFSAAIQPQVITYQWDHGNGSTSVGPDAWHTYDVSGVYDVQLTVIDNNGCTGSVTTINAVQVSGGPPAEFTLSSRRISVEDPEFTVEHVPDTLVTYSWTFGGDSIDVSAPFTWTIQGAEVGFYPVCLIATDSLGCFNVSCEELLIDDVMTIYVPNAFTPNGDGANDAFLPSVLGIDPTSYSLFIADRWGIPVFTSDDPTVAWDGTFNNGGELLPQDVYVWQIVARDQFSADRREFKGSVTLLK